MAINSYSQTFIYEVSAVRQDPSQEVSIDLKKVFPNEPPIENLLEDQPCLSNNTSLLENPSGKKSLEIVYSSLEELFSQEIEGESAKERLESFLEGESSLIKGIKHMYEHTWDRRGKSYSCWVTSHYDEINKAHIYFDIKISNYLSVKEKSQIGKKLKTIKKHFAISSSNKTKHIFLKVWDNQSPQGFNMNDENASLIVRYDLLKGLCNNCFVLQLKETKQHYRFFFLSLIKKFSKTINPTNCVTACFCQNLKIQKVKKQSQKFRGEKRIRKEEKSNKKTLIDFTVKKQKKSGS